MKISRLPDLEEGAEKDLDGVEKEFEAGAEMILVLEAGAEKSWGLAEARDRTKQTRTTEGDMLLARIFLIN